MSKITFFTVCGGGEEREFLLGSVRHHAQLGNHYIFDVLGRKSGSWGKLKLPTSVKIFRATNPAYWRSGDWKQFRLASALEFARKAALKSFPETEFLVNLDCDEYYDVDKLRDILVPDEKPKAFIFPTIHWKGGQALRFGKSEYHLRAWDVRAGVKVVKNLAWVASPHYNGNPEHHPIFNVPPEYERVVTEDPVHYHLHYQLGSKQYNEETAKATIGGWPDGTAVSSPCPIPRELRDWGMTGKPPSATF